MAMLSRPRRWNWQPPRSGWLTCLRPCALYWTRLVSTPAPSQICGGQSWRHDGAAPHAAARSAHARWFGDDHRCVGRI